MAKKLVKTGQSFTLSEKHISHSDDKRDQRNIYLHM